MMRIDDQRLLDLEDLEAWEQSLRNLETERLAAEKEHNAARAAAIKARNKLAGLEAQIDKKLRSRLAPAPLFDHAREQQAKGRRK